MANIFAFKMMGLYAIEMLQEAGKNSNGTIEIDLNKAYI